MIPSASHKKTNDKALELIFPYIQKNKKILDLGSGRGHLTDRIKDLMIQKRIDPKKHLLAADIFHNIFEVKNIPFKKTDFNKKFPFKASSFDLIYSIEVIEHIRSPYDFISECYRILKPGGILILSTPNILHLTSRFKFFVTGFYDLFEPPSILPANAGRLCGHIMPLTIAYYDYGLRSAGFKNINLSIDKTKSLSSFFYYLLLPFIKFSSYKFKNRVMEYDKLVYKENFRALCLINSKIICTSRSLIVLTHKT